jgi:hypothetical protein
MSKSEPCQSYRLGELVCADGFPQNSACMGLRCHACGRYSDKVPMCEREDIPAQFLTEAGAPLFYRPDLDEATQP